ncbi:uncharacterized protein LOC115888329 [Sitophilus oryzae]|uniref:Uncharacterized protein LOC115888329 n=1 Tax=Sitophilus oryzae TaxID=7048 RepID=A0A6J2YL52_SITOR|nr:uncharacterized protein LOC115888329 [Sitophilus oryzae]
MHRNKNHVYYEKLHFRKKLSDDRKRKTYVAACLFCHTEVRNTSYSGLIQHRIVCKREQHKFSPAIGTGVVTAVTNATKDHTENVSNGSTKKRKLDIQSKIVNDTKQNLSPLPLSTEVCKKLGFGLVDQVNDSNQKIYFALCLVCSKIMTNITSEKLMSHRTVCYSERYSLSQDLFDVISDDDSNTLHSEIQEKEDKRQINQSKVNKNKSPKKVEEKPASSVHLPQAVANFIFSTNLPFDILQSVQFQRLIEIANPDLISQIPSTDSLVKETLDKVYQCCLEDVKKKWQHSESVLVIGMLNLDDNHRYFVALLRNALDGEEALINSKRIKAHENIEENMSIMAKECISIVSSSLNTDIYAVIMEKSVEAPKRNDVGPCYITCHRHIASTLLSGLLDIIDVKTCLFKVQCIVEELKKVQIKGNLIYKKSEVNFQVDNIFFLVNNWSVIEESLNDSQIVNRNILDLRSVLTDREFKESCEDYVHKFVLVQGFIKNLSSSKCSLANAKILWNNLLNNPLIRHSDVIYAIAKSKFEQTNNFYTMLAYYFGEGRNKEFTKKEQEEISLFIKKSIPQKALKEYDRFESEILELTDARDEYYSCEDFWSSIAEDFPNICQLAFRILSIPASVGDLKTEFSHFSQNYHALDDEQCKKLIFIYFNLRNNFVENVSN